MTSWPSRSSTWIGVVPTRVTSTTAGPSVATTLTRPATSLTSSRVIGWSTVMRRGASSVQVSMAASDVSR
jgi:hypothetical protein